MDTKHTPGPWIADEDGWIADSSGTYVVDYAGCGTHEAYWSNPADKALVLAAPDLLEALQELRYACTDKAEMMADAAIEKALGKAIGA